MTTPKINPLHGILFAVFGFAMFSTHDAIIKSFHGGLSVVQIMFFSTIFSFPWVSTMIMTDGRPENFKPNRPFMLIARTVLGLGAGGFAFTAFMILPFADVYGLLFTTPLFITLLSIPFLGEKVGKFRAFAVLLGFAGVLVMLPLQLDQFSMGHLAAFCSALCSSGNAIVTRKIGQTEREAVMMMLPMGISLVILGALMPFGYYAPTSVQLYKLMIIGGLGFFAQLCIIAAYKRSEAAIIAPMQYSQLIWAIIYGSLFFNEEVSSRKLIGAAIIISSGLFILYRETRGHNSANRPASSFRNFRPDTSRSWIKSKEN